MRTCLKIYSGMLQIVLEPLSRFLKPRTHSGRRERVELARLDLLLYECGHCERYVYSRGCEHEYTCGPLWNTIYEWGCSYYYIYSPLRLQLYTMYSMWLQSSNQVNSGPLRPHLPTHACVGADSSQIEDSLEPTRPPREMGPSSLRRTRRRIRLDWTSFSRKPRRLRDQWPTGERYSIPRYGTERVII